MQPITKNLQKFLLYFVGQYRWRFTAMAVSYTAYYVLDNLMLPFAFNKLFIDRLYTLDNNRTAAWLQLGWPLFVLLAVIFFIDILSRFSDYLKVRTIPTFEARVRMWIVSYVQNHSYQLFTENFSGDLVRRIDNLTDGVSQLVMRIIDSFLPTFCTMLLGVLSFTLVQPVFGIMLMVWLLLYTLIYYLFAKKFTRYAMVHAEKVSLLSGSIMDGFTNVLSMKLFAFNQKDAAHLSVPQEAEQKAHEHVLRMIMYLHCIIGVLSIAFMGIGLIGQMVYYWQLGKLDIPTIVYIATTGTNLCNLVWDLLADFPAFFEEIGYCSQALQLLQQKHAIVDLPAATTLQCPSAPAIAFNQISFSYSSTAPLFEQQDLYIAAGEKVGLVGLSGSGKSTFAYLLLRFYDLQGGNITINGQDIATVTQSSLRAAISLVPQDTILFHTTVLENIRYGHQGATEAEVIAAAQSVGCHDFIMQLPANYQTLVGERGAKLSGGQRQRIAIVRAVLKNAPILILDESTSALDALTENAIQESLRIAMTGRTTLVIAHRISALSAMDRIVVLEHGKIIAEGSHDLLLRTNAYYAAMCQLQPTII
ncbi:ABC transporter ATP-binding protein [Candidatus Cardinium hertigii]|uniref:ATM1-type heavy metal exporter n=1 Tax=Candidatus Cardinium hertigii TaxID=247481 RepID=A0A2Z3LD15_9BACT|nr:ABC transporter ATP-binding protein [Candidatus Cardinium hertigii]AWN81726.1 ATM1-type heavy metal exporter [Candidatus Cardinium hertigii]